MPSNDELILAFQKAHIGGADMPCEADSVRWTFPIYRTTDKLTVEIKPEPNYFEVT